MPHCCSGYLAPTLLLLLTLAVPALVLDHLPLPGRGGTSIITLRTPLSHASPSQSLTSLCPMLLAERALFPHLAGRSTLRAEDSAGG